MAQKAMQAGRKLPILGWVAVLVVVPAVLYVGYVINQIREVEKRDLRLLGTAVQRIERVLRQAEKTVQSLEGDFSFAGEFDSRQPYLMAHHEHAGEPNGLEQLQRWEQLGCRAKLGSLVGISTRFEQHEDHLLLEAQVCEAEALRGADRGCESHDAEGDHQAPAGECPSLDQHFTFRVELGEILEEISFGDAFDLLVLADEYGHVLLESRPPSTDLGLRVSHLEPLLASSVAAARDGDPKPLAAAKLPKSSVQLDVRLVEEEFKLFCQPMVLAGFHPEHDKNKGGEAGQEGEERGTATERTIAIWSLCGLVSSERNLRSALGVAPQLVLGLLLFVIASLITWPFLKLLFMDRRERFRFVDAYLLLLSTFTLLLLVSILLFDADSYLGLKRRVQHGMTTLADQVERHLLEELVCLQEQLQRLDRKVLGLERATAEVSPGATRILMPASQRQGDDLQLTLAAGDYEYFSSVFWMRTRPSAKRDDAGMQVAKATIHDRNTPPVNRRHREYFLAVRDERMWDLSDYTGDHPSCPFAEAAPPGGDRRFFFQTYRSDTTGIRSAALSLPSQRSLPPPTPAPGETTAEEPVPLVAAITVEPLSVLHPVLPPGYGFAVIDADGNALFHSDPLQALEQNLFPELEDADRLRSALRSRTARHFDTTYQTRPSMAFVRPLEVVPWSIVTFYDHELLRTVNLEALARAFLYGALYLLLFNLPLGLWVALRGRHADWLWPRETYQELYRKLTLIYAAMLAFFLLAVAALPAGPLLVASFGLPFALGIGGWIASRRWGERRRAADSPGRPGDRGSTNGERSESGVEGGEPADEAGNLLGSVQTALSRFGHPTLRWHIAAVTLFWLLAAVLPGLGFFKVAWSQQLESMARLHGLHLHEQLTARAQRVAEEYREVALPHREQFLERRLRASALPAEPSPAEAPGTVAFDLYLLRNDPPLEHPLLRSEVLPAMKPGPPVRESPLEKELARHLPLYNRSVLALRYLVGASAADASLRWWVGTLDPAGKARTGEERAIFLGTEESSTEPTVVATSLADSGPWSGYLLWCGGLALLVLLLFWVRYGALRLFFARIGRQVDPISVIELESRVAAMTGPGEAPVCIVALIASPPDRLRLAASATFHRVDMFLLTEDELEQRIKQASKSLRPLLCERFESGLRDPEIRDRKLRLLEHLVLKEKRPIVLPTTLNPFEDLFWFRRVLVDERLVGIAEEREPPAPRAGSIRLEDDRALRWGQVLSPFRVQPIGLELGESRPQRHPRTVEHKLPHEREEALERLIEEREGHYWALWNACSADEQLVLVHLTEEGVVNPKQQRLVRRLLQRGLLVRDPRLRLMEERFAHFVRRIHEPLDVARWERAVQGLGWKQLRWAFLSILAVIALFLFATQQALFDATLGFVSTLAVGLPGLLKLITNFRRGATSG